MTWSALALGLVNSALPPLPPGIDPEFQRLAKAAAEASLRGDWPAARHFARRLPGLEVTYEARRQDGRPFSPEEQAALDVASVPFRRERTAYRFRRVTAGGQVRVTFGTAPSQFRFGAQPRLEFSAPLMIEGEPARPAQMRNLVTHALGRYLGLAPVPVIGSVSFEQTAMTNRPLELASFEADTIKKASEFAQALRTRIERGQAVSPVAGGIFFDPSSLTTGDVDQGSRAEYTLQLTNNGTGTLTYRTIGDCACVLAPSGGTLEPGETDLLRPRMDTTDFVGRMDKRLILFTNDPQRPVIEIPLVARAVPRYRFFPAQPVWDFSRQKEFVLGMTAPNPDWRPLDVYVEGMEADVRQEPWTGTAADPLLSEGPQPRRGMRLVITPRKALAPGRHAVNVYVGTGERRPNTARFGFFVQSGLVAVPERVFFGVVDAPGRRASVLLAGANRRPKILSSILPKYLGLQTAPGDERELKVSLRYLGGAPSGEIRGTVVLRTDDPSRAEVRIPYEGIIP
jgi:hypothetical protein